MVQAFPYLVSYLCTMQMFSCRFTRPKHFWNHFFDYLCNYHDVRGLGKIDHLSYRKRITSIYKRDGGYAFYFKSQTKDNKRKPEGGILRDRKKIEHVIDCFCNLVTSEHRIKILKQWVDDNVEKNRLNESWHYDHYVWMWQNLLLMILMMIYEHLKVFWFLQSDCVGWSWSSGSRFFFQIDLVKM